MKKLIFTFLAFSLVFTAVGSADTSAKTALSAGTLIKGINNPTVYYYAEDNKRYVFPNSHTFYSWFDNFSNVVEINDDELPLYPLGGNVRYKPGALLVKIQTNPKVYAVGNNGLLRWIKTEALAKALYGENWSLLVDDVPDSFFVNYNVGDPIEDESEYEPADEEEETDLISRNLGLMAKKQIQNRIRTMNQKFCGDSEGAINRIQKRLQRWNITQDNIGDDYIGQCVNAGDGSDAPATVSGNKITICHIPKGNPANAHTITIARPSLKAHLNNGDLVGACDGDDGEEPDTADSDATVPVISGISTDIGTSTATISWATDESAKGKVMYATESLSTASEISEAASSDFLTAQTVELTGLTTSTEYFFMIEAKDGSDNIATSTEQSFTTSS